MTMYEGEAFALVKYNHFHIISVSHDVLEDY